MASPLHSTPLSMASPEETVSAILDQLYPLLTSPTNATVSRILTTFRSSQPPPNILAASLSTFAKIINVSHPALPPFRNLISALNSAHLLTNANIVQFFDVESRRLLHGDKVSQEYRKFRTRVFYTQRRFNLFRDENEGYAKIISYLWEISGISGCPSPTQSTDEIIATITATVGHYALDSNRVIEIVLSAAADIIYFNVKPSGPKPADYRMPPLMLSIINNFEKSHVAGAVGAMLQAEQPTNRPDTGSPSSSNSAPMSPTASVASSHAAKPENVHSHPDSLLFLLIVLVREGIITISAIWKNMSPADDRELAKLCLSYEQQLQELEGMIGPDSVNRRTQGKATNPQFERTGAGASERDIFAQYLLVQNGPYGGHLCQKLYLINLLINVGRWDDAMEAILCTGVDGEHVDICAHPRIGMTLAKFIEILLNPVLCKHFPGQYQNLEHLRQAIEKWGGRKNRYPCSVMTVNEFLDDCDENGGGAVVVQMLSVLGANARAAPTLLNSLCRLLELHRRPTRRAVKIMQEVVFPANSLLSSQFGLNSAIWNVLKNWGHTERWSVYGYVRNIVSRNCAAYSLSASRAKYEMRYVLKRLTSETQYQHMNTIAKITCGQSLVAFDAAIHRIQGYPPDVVTVKPVVEACQKCSELAVDVLLYLIIDKMGDSTRSRLKDDGINIAQWYATLSLFLGLCLRKLRVKPQQIEGVLSFLYKKLVIEQEALLITALSDVIMCVADIGAESNLTTMQIEAQGGGKFLRAAVSGIWARLQPNMKVVGNAFDNKMEREKRRAVAALLASFHDTGMHVYIAIAIAQLARDSVYQEELRGVPLKLGANIVDRARSSLLQLSQFMEYASAENRSNGKTMLDIWGPLRSIGLGNLIGEMGVSTSCAITLMSPVVDFLRDVWKAGDKNKRPRSADRKTSSLGEQEAGDIGSGATRLTSANSSSQREPQSENCDMMEIEAGEIETQDGAISDDSMQRDSSPKVCISDSVDSFATIIAKRTRGLVTEEFIKVFWTLKLDDIWLKTDLYTSEYERLQKVRKTWEREVDKARWDAERKHRCEAELRRIRDFIESLGTEKKEHESKHAAVLEALRSVGPKLYPKNSAETSEVLNETVCVILQECILPRSKISSSDAIFSAKFILLLLKLDIPTFSFSRLYKCLLKVIPTVLSSCSEDEASSIARLIKEVMTVLERWRSHKQLYDEEVSSKKLTGFRDDEEAPCKPMPHEHYCQWLFDIHSQLTEGLCLVLEAGEYLCARNSLCVIAGAAEVFPKVMEHSEKIEARVRVLSNSELPDMELASKGVLARLRSGKAKRLPKRIFTLKIGNSGLTSAANVKRKSAAKVDSSKDASASIGAAVTKGAPAQSRKQANPVPQEQEKTIQAKKPDHSAAAGTHRDDASGKFELNPNAKEFVPDAANTDKSSVNTTPSTIGSKRTRERDPGMKPEGELARDSKDENKAKDRVDEMPPPKKRPRGAENRASTMVASNQSTMKPNTDAQGIMKAQNSSTSSPKKLASVPSTVQKPAVASTDQSLREEGVGREKGKNDELRPGGDNQGKNANGGPPAQAVPGPGKPDREKVEQTAANPTNRGNAGAAARADPGPGGFNHQKAQQSPKGREVSHGQGNSVDHNGVNAEMAVNRENQTPRDGPSNQASQNNRQVSSSRDGPVLRDGGQRADGQHRDGSKSREGHSVRESASVREGPSREMQGRNLGDREHVAGEAGRDLTRKDSHPRNLVQRDNPSREQINRWEETRWEPPGRDVSNAMRDVPGKDSYGRNVSRQESPGRGNVKRGSSHDLHGREANGNMGKDGHRRRRPIDAHSPYRHGHPGDSGGPGHEMNESDAHGGKRRRDFGGQRNSFTYENDGRRGSRHREEEGVYRGGIEREDGGRRFNGEQAPGRDPGRYDGGPKAGGRIESRARGHEFMHDSRPSGGVRRRDHEMEGVAGRKSRPDERNDYDDRDRHVGRGRDDGRVDDYMFSDRMGNRMGERGYRRNSRDDRGGRQRAFAQQDRRHNRTMRRQRP
eukprot:GFKZ01005579.1.p1 GENE.GFKZ01005579.1~~GFKZ01005579.1.p1  ORF type:complete len:2014 (+),score=252.98 GFKZ01005579.1:387-6428(+)